MHPLAQKIATLQRRITLRAYATAACSTVAMLLAAAATLGFADYLTRFRDPGLRIMATTTLAAVSVFAAYRWWYRPGRKRLGQLTVARKVESHFPQLNDSLASAVEFLQQSENDQTAGSAQLRRIVVAEAESATAGLPLDEVIDRRPLRRAAAYLLLVCLMLGAWLAWDTAAVRTAFARLALPFGGAQWPRQNYLAFPNPPTKLAAGQTFEAELIDKNGNLPEEVRVVYRLSDGSRPETVSEPMTRVGDMMIARREDVRQPFAFRATGGDDDLMRWHQVDVIEPPQLKSLTITIHPPAYTGEAASPGPSLSKSAAGRHLDVLAGTQIELRGTATKPLTRARILQGEAGSSGLSLSKSAAGAINATITNTTSFHVPPANWTAEKSTPYSLELTGTDGLTGVVGQWNLRVEPDSPPSVAWVVPSEDLFVLPGALVPIELAVKDNLKIARVELIYDRSDWSEAEREREAPAARIELFRGPKSVSPPLEAVANQTSKAGSVLAVDYAWDLAPLDLPAGAEVAITAEAADYRPGIGKSASPRRITIITPDELDARLAERLAQIGQQLERALTIERTTREHVRRLEMQQHQAGPIKNADRNLIQSAELSQRQVFSILASRENGVPALIDALLRELELNRIPQSDVRGTIGQVAAELKGLASGPLEVADRELTAGRKAIAENGNEKPLPPDQAESLLGSLTAAGTAQDDIIQTLERLVSELSGKSDFLRFVQLLTELREDQLAHEQATRLALGVATLPLRASDLTRAQQTSLNTAAAGQNSIATRYSKLEHGMDTLAQESTNGEAASAAGADTLSTALDLSRSLAINSKMTETARDIAENRIGSALDRESQIANDLQQVLDVLRRTAEREPEQLAEQLNDAEKQLDALRKRLAELRQQIANTEQQPANTANQQQHGALNKQQQDLRGDIDKLARQLDRLQAANASQSAQSAANRLENQKLSEGRPQQPSRPSPSSDVQQAENDLAAAADQLADRRQQLEDDLALEFIRRLQTELAEMVERQKHVVEQTARLDESRPPNASPPADAEQTAKLADEERALAQMAKDHSEVLHGLGAVRVSLEEAERRLLAAGTLLDRRNTGPDAQQAERQALARLQGMMDTFAQTANEAQPDQPPPNAGAGANGQRPQRRPTFELLEVKMLRMLQVDLQARTREYQQRSAGLKPPTSDNQRAALKNESQELAAEQGRLVELVEDMLKRDNKTAE